MDTNICSQSPIGPAGYIYFHPISKFPKKEASLLSDAYNGCKACTLPLLQGFTVECDFHVNVKTPYQKLLYESITVKPTKFHNHVIVFHNTHIIEPVFHGPGLEKLCTASRELFGFSSFTPKQKSDTASAARLLGEKCTEYIGWVAITDAFKERLFSGELVAIPDLMIHVQINGADCLRIPLHDSRLAVASETHPPFFDEHVSKLLYESYYTSIAQAVRILDVTGFIAALEDRVVTEQYKTPKFGNLKIYPSDIAAGQLGNEIKVIDAAVTELAISHGLSFLEAPQESTPILNYSQWPMFSKCDSENDRVNALHEWNARQALHVHAQLLSANSVLYVTRIGRTASKGPTIKSDELPLNAYYLQHGLAYLNSQCKDETGNIVFPGIPEADLSGSSYTIYHLAYAASMSPNILARMCYYLQMCQHQKLVGSQTGSIQNYVTTTANSTLCELCEGSSPAVCIHTLFYRVKDRFPQVYAPQKRDPYVITGATGQHNDMEILGNFGNFREKDEDVESTPRYTYWQVNQNLLERLEEQGIFSTSQPGEVISDVPSFLSTFKTIDAIVDGEVLKFTDSLVKNGISFRETIKSITHILQVQCNTNWIAPCPILHNLFVRSFLAILQDMSFPLCVSHQNDNPYNYGTVSTWLNNHFQTLWSNFKSTWFDKGVLSCNDMRVSHNENATDLSELPKPLSAQRLSVRLSRAQVFSPRVLKLKNRIIFSNSNSSESLSSSFIKSGKSENPVVSGPYMPFLSCLHRQLFPQTKTAAYYVWQTFQKTKKLPSPGKCTPQELTEFVNYIVTNSTNFEEINVLDFLPTSFTSYAKQRLNNAILRLCGQTQFYATTVNFLQADPLTVPGLEYPHVAGVTKIHDMAQYLSLTQDKLATIVQSTCKDDNSGLCKLRPIVTLPIMINKYSGSNGNNSVFQSGNMGYFIGRGVDKKLLPDFNRLRKQVNTSVRKRFIFATPTVDSLLKIQNRSSVQSFEVEKTRKHVIETISSGNCSPESIVMELIKCVGVECKNLTREDICFYLGDFAFLTDEVLAVIMDMKQLGCSFTEKSAGYYINTQQDNTQEAYMEIPEAAFSGSTLPGAAQYQIECVPTKRRKLNPLDEIDLQ